MKNIITGAILIIVLMASCGSSSTKKPRDQSKVITGNGNGYLKLHYIGGCTYVIYHAGYGSDLEHHAACGNPKCQHRKN